MDQLNREATGFFNAIARVLGGQDSQVDLTKMPEIYLTTAVSEAGILHMAQQLEEATGPRGQTVRRADSMLFERMPPNAKLCVAVLPCNIAPTSGAPVSRYSDKHQLYAITAAPSGVVSCERRVDFFS